ncbi:DUF3784 domain-containing protein [Terribacillus sp. 7520-G]|uniref:DUF3784 domain-containing protein n=1 Tax=unclassified Terribacillus TaxID=2636508 RepID=UPI000BA6210B|nr:DUF3784 domain-containing protein [Terribacillus sp. 7520-G]PAD39186.1 hypothetical protein CHH53_07735 [Terribacillus sp. 7520-G]
MEHEIFSVFLGIVFIVLAYLVNVKKMVGILRGYNQQRIRDKQKFIDLVSPFYLVSGAILILVPFIFSPEWSMVAIHLVIMANLILLIYVNVKMVDK